MADGVDLAVASTKALLAAPGAKVYLGRIRSASPSQMNQPARVTVTVEDMTGGPYSLPFLTTALDEEIRTLGNAAMEYQVLIVSVAGQWVGVGLVQPGGVQ